jgi:hypothetical protein
VSKVVTFAFGPAVGLGSRRLTVVQRQSLTTTVVALANPDPCYDATLAGSAVSGAVTLAANKLWQATLVDTDDAGNVSRKDVISFGTNANKYPGPSSIDRLRVLSIYDS